MIQKLGLIYRNNLGIISNITKHITKNNGYIIDCNIYNLENYMAFDINASLPKNQIYSFNNFIPDYKLNNNFLKNNEYKNRMIYLDLYTQPENACNIIDILEDINSNIKYVQISTDSAPFSSIPLFSMKINSKIDKRYNKDSLEKIFNFIDDGELKII